MLWMCLKFAQADLAKKFYEEIVPLGKLCSVFAIGASGRVAWEFGKS